LHIVILSIACGLVACSKTVTPPSRTPPPLSDDFWQPVEGFSPTEHEQKVALIAREHLGDKRAQFYKVERRGDEYNVWINYAMPDMDGKPMGSLIHCTVVISSDLEPVRILPGA
jgi:hypothetical protein